MKISVEMLANDGKIKNFPAFTSFDGNRRVFTSGVSNHYIKPPAFALVESPNWDPGNGKGYAGTELLEKLKLPFERIYPIQLRDLESPSISNFSVIGSQSRQLPWRVVKTMWDGDALHVKGCTGKVTVSDVYWENVEDGFGPMPRLSFWRLERAYMKYIRDDAIENDHLISGEIINCLIDGCYVFLSQRSGDSKAIGTVTTIKDCLVWLQPQPHDGIENRQWRNDNIKIGADGVGTAPGMLFKWQRNGGVLRVENCIFRVDRVSFNGAKDMVFPPGVYSDVILIWAGRGDYPAPLPRGVKLTRDLSIWKTARQKWLDALPSAHPAYRKVEPEN